MLNIVVYSRVCQMMRLKFLYLLFNLCFPSKTGDCGLPWRLCNEHRANCMYDDARTTFVHHLPAIYLADEYRYATAYIHLWIWCHTYISTSLYFREERSFFSVIRLYCYYIRTIYLVHGRYLATSDQVENKLP